MTLALNIRGSTSGPAAPAPAAAAPAAPNSKRVLLLPSLLILRRQLVVGLCGGTLDREWPAISDEHIWGNFGSLGSC